MSQRIVNEVSQIELEGAMRNVLTEIVTDSILSRYEGTLVGTKEAAKILRVDEQTVRDYVKFKKFEAVEHSGRNLQFDLRYLLEFNINEVKGRKLRTA